MTRITAKEARELASRSLDEKIDALLDVVKAAAKNRRRSLLAGWDYRKDLDLWVDGGYSSTKEWVLAKQKLEELGYSVKFFYQEGSIVVDMYTIVSW